MRTHSYTHTSARAIAHTQNSVRVMVIAAFQRIRGLIGYRFGDVMRLIIEPAAGAREGRLAGPHRERSVYTRAHGRFSLCRGGNAAALLGPTISKMAKRA